MLFYFATVRRKSMKITKRILAVLLLMVLLVSCLMLTVSAEDPFSADGIDDVEDILEYYALDDYLADNYEEDGWTRDFYSGANSAIVADPTDENNNVLKVSGKNNKYSAASLTDKLIVSFNIYYDTAMSGEYKVDVKTIDPNGAESITYTTLFSVNAYNGVFQYSVWDDTLNNGEGGFVINTFDGLSPVADTWYNIVLFFNASEGQYNFKISSDGGENWVYSDVYGLGNVVKVSRFELKAYANSRNSVISLYLDNVEVYAGSFERSPSNKNNITAQTLIDLENLYLAQETDSATRVRIAQVLDQLINGYGYVPADSTPEIERVNVIISKTPEYINIAFADELIARAAAIDVTKGYYDRLAFVAESEYYNDSIPANDSLSGAAGLDDAAISAIIEARALFAAELEACQNVAEDSAKFLKKMSEYNPESKDYDGYLKEFYEEVTSYTYRDLTYAEPVDGVDGFTMEEAAVIYEEFVAKYTRLDAASQAFIDGATEMKNALDIMKESQPGAEEYEAAFESLANGCVICGSVYNDGDIDPDLDESTHTALYSLFSVYLDNKSAVEEEISRCLAFLDIIKKATTATYYTAKLEHLANAESYVSNVRTAYEGVADAILLYNQLKAAVEGAENASEAYINAVNAINDSMSFAEKQAAIEAALALKDEGDVIGIAGVQEANVKLSAEKSAIETLILNSESIKTLVTEIESTSDFAERRALLARAAQAASNCEESLDGVAAAVDKFEELMSDFTSQVQAMNASHSAATVKAAEIAGAASSGAGVYKAADIIKNYLG